MRRAPLLAAALLAAGFLVVQLRSIDSYGESLEEEASLYRGDVTAHYLHSLLTGRDSVLDDRIHALSAVSHPAAFEALNYAAYRIARRSGMGEIPAGHLLIVVAGSLAIFFLFLAGRFLVGDAAALAAAFFFALDPPWIFHAQVNPTEAPAVAASLFALWLAFRARERPTALRWVVAGLAFGAAIDCGFQTLLALPLVVWAALAPYDKPLDLRDRRHGARLAFAAAGAAVGAYLCWPSLWDDPLSICLVPIHLLGSSWSGFVLYGGHFYEPPDLPWHYGVGMLAAATPCLHLIFAAAGAAVLARRSGRFAKTSLAM
ncbi:MAG: glycosyltransferase family 39 protein, partial [Elusimicrobia bacterium]|nr:glycosyltransferase family 39 protein [Elusimicrobiota bacterium]